MRAQDITSLRQNCVEFSFCMEVRHTFVQHPRQAINALEGQYLTRTQQRKYHGPHTLIHTCSSMRGKINE